jgi:hypothetical protein
VRLFYRNQGKNSMKRGVTLLFLSITAAVCLSCGAFRTDASVEQHTANQFDYGSAPDRQSEVRFQDRTKEVFADAMALIDKRDREGAPLDQRWYAFRRFGENLPEVLAAKEVRFYGGRELDVRTAIAGGYVSMTPLVANQDPGEIRLFKAWRGSDVFDLVIIGQNGREVALKTAIRLVYFFKLMDHTVQQRFVGGLHSFLQKIKIYQSSITPRQEFTAFFRQHRIADPDAVMIGFQRDTRSLLKEAGSGEPERYSSDSLRINWYPDVAGQKVLLVSINGNRIFASRAGDLMAAIFETFRSSPRSIVFFGSGGAIDAAHLIGRIVAPTVVTDGDFFNPHRRGKPAQIIRNRAAAILPVQTAHTSVESVETETFDWAATNKRSKIMTVDQELFHIISSFNASPYSNQTQLFVAILVTDNVSASQEINADTLQYADKVIAQTTAMRRQFLSRVLAEIGVAHGAFGGRRSAIDGERRRGVAVPAG